MSISNKNVKATAKQTLLHFKRRRNTTIRYTSVAIRVSLKGFCKSENLSEYLKWVRHANPTLSGVLMISNASRINYRAAEGRFGKGSSKALDKSAHTKSYLELTLPFIRPSTKFTLLPEKLELLNLTSYIFISQLPYSTPLLEVRHFYCKRFLGFSVLEGGFATLPPHYPPYLLTRESLRRERYMDPVLLYLGLLQSMLNPGEPCNLYQPRTYIFIILSWCFVDFNSSK